MASTTALWRHLLAISAAALTAGYLVVKLVLVGRQVGGVPFHGLELAKFAGAALVAPVLMLVGLYLVTARDAWRDPDPAARVRYNGKEYASMDEAMGKKKHDAMKVAGGVLSAGVAAFGFAVWMLHASVPTRADLAAPAPVAPVQSR